MVYVYAKQSKINEYVGEKLSIEQIDETLKDMGMDMKGISDEEDPEMKVEITAEKMDMVSTVGIGRAVRFYRGISKKLPEYKIGKAKNKVIVDKSVEAVRPKTVCVILRDVNMTAELLDEMIEIQEKIHDSFGRHRKKASIGIYPMDEFSFPVTFSGENPKDIIFHPLEGESEMSADKILETHDTGKKFAHLLSGQKVFPVFRDSNKEVLSLPPVINSNKTGRVDLHHKDLFVEISGFNLTYLDNLLKVLTTTFLELGCSAEAVSVEYSSGENYELSLENSKDKISLDYINKLIGIKISSSEVKKLALKVMLEVESIKGDEITFLIPPYRTDIWHDSDIADDIARAYGYNNIVPELPEIATIGGTLEVNDFRDRLGNTMVNFGFIELYSYMLTSTKTQFSKMAISEPDKKFEKLLDSEDQGLNMLRVRILPEILESLLINRKNKYPQQVFENGFTIQKDVKAETGARNVRHLCAAIADPKTNYTKIKGAFDTFMKLNNIDFEIKVNDKIPFLISGRSAEIIVSGKSVGFIGEVCPEVLTNFGLLVPVAVFELVIDDVYGIINK
jgi:phenylalanyl-tRNA synthetase beta chain